jgi:hypothetical protein
MRWTRWWAGAACVACVLAVPAAASARSVTTTPKKLGAGRIPVASCGTITGLQPNFTIVGGTVTAVVFTGIPTTCNAGSLSATVTNAGTSLGAGGPVTIASGAATVPISPGAAVGSVTHVRIAIVGP